MKKSRRNNAPIYHQNPGQAGFTLLEILITMGVLAMLVGVSFQGISLVQESTAQFNDREIRNILYSAEQRAKNGVADNAWGIYLQYDEISREGTSIMLFAGTSYLTRDQTLDLPFVLQGEIDFPNVSLRGSGSSSGNDHEVVFSKFSGATSQYGTITIQTPYTNSIIRISPEGIVVQE